MFLHHFRRLFWLDLGPTFRQVAGKGMEKGIEKMFQALFSGPCPFLEESFKYMWWRPPAHGPALGPAHEPAHGPGTTFVNTTFANPWYWPGNTKRLIIINH